MQQEEPTRQSLLNWLGETESERMWRKVNEAMAESMKYINAKLIQDIFVDSKFMKDLRRKSV